VGRSEGERGGRATRFIFRSTGTVPMTTVQDVPSTPVKESEPLIAGPESAFRLIVVAVGWFLLAEAVAAAVRRFAPGFVRELTKGASQVEIPSTSSHLLFTVGAFGSGIVLLYAASIRGRIVGGGDRRLGLGVAPIARLPIIIGLSTVVVLYAALIDFAVYEYRPDLFFKSSSVPLWLILFDSLVIIVLAPLAEELLFRGWLWTGLRKLGGVLPTGLMTAVLWLLPHLPRGMGYVGLLLFPALILTIARHVGESVRATIFIHAIFNLTGNLPLIVLFLKLFQN
jgi:membrane protease YdiL (CAAX protease family)